MNERGFTLVELICTIAIMAILMTIATMQFRQYTIKANIEKQVRTLYADIMNARSDAVMKKVVRSFGVTATGFKVYATIDGTGAPLLQTTFTYPIVSDVSIVPYFDTRGVANNISTMTICVQPLGNPAAIDSIIVGQTMIQMGKWRGGDCTSANIDAK